MIDDDGDVACEGVGCGPPGRSRADWVGRVVQVRIWQGVCVCVCVLTADDVARMHAGTCAQTARRIQRQDLYALCGRVCYICCTRDVLLFVVTS
jgi:hypothetical protein